MTSIVELEERQAALVQRLDTAGAVLTRAEEPVPGSEGPGFAVWELRGRRIDVPDLDSLELGRVATMLLEAEGILSELTPAPDA